MKKIFISSLSLFFCAAAHGQSRLYVDEAAGGANNGLSWASAYEGTIGLQNALAYASTHPSVTEIWVAAGTYVAAEEEGRPANPTVSFAMRNGLAIYGGFLGGETMLSERDVSSNTTTLSGYLGPMSENSYNVVNGAGTNSTAVLDGFLITGGAQNASNPGGGIRISTGSPTISNCTITNNSGSGNGGGMFVNGSPTITNCVFDNNTADQGGGFDGGGVYVAGGSPTFDQCTFNDNEANEGGGARVAGGAPTFRDCSFSLNFAGSGGGADVVASATFIRCFFQFNGSAGPGGAISSTGTSSLVNCTITGSTGGTGGGVYTTSGSSSFTNCQFNGNLGFRGGAVYSSDSPTYTNCTFAVNTASNDGGGMYNLSGSPTITNCIFWNNQDTGGNNDEQAQIYVAAGSPVVNYCDILGLTGGLGGTNNIGSNPLFISQPGQNFRLQPSSPCIDAGQTLALPNDIYDLDNDANTSERIPRDRDHNRRFVNDPKVTDTGVGEGMLAVVDMGAYEVQSPLTRLYVDINASGANDGASWADAFNTVTGVKNALDLAAGTPTVTEIWVATGTYKASSSGDPEATHQLLSGVGVYGGFIGGETDLSQRDVFFNIVTLSGDLNGDDLPNFVNRGDNSFHVVNASGTDNTARLDGGIHVRGGNAYLGPEHDRGGGCYNDGGDAVFFRVTFQDNRADDAGIGGGMYNVNDADPTLELCQFQFNRAGFGGGFASVGAQASPFLYFCTVENNTANFHGGGIAVFDGSTVSGFASSILNNTAPNGHGGGMYLTGSGASTWTSSAISFNTAFKCGGGVALTGPGASTLTFEDCNFDANISMSDIGGGAILAQNAPLVVVRTLFLDNEGPTGGAIGVASSGTLTAVNCSFFGNDAANSGGAIHMQGGSSGSATNCLFSGNVASTQLGGGIDNTSSSLEIINCTLANNSAVIGGGLATNSGAVVVRNTVFWNNDDNAGMVENSQLFFGGGSIDVAYSLIQGLTGGLGGVGNIDVNPLFVDADGADNTFGTTDDDTRLLPGSLCIDAADSTAVPMDALDVDADSNTTERIPRDLDNHARFVDDPSSANTGVPASPVVDMGPYEFFVDCNSNEVPDECDVSCGGSNGPCDVPLCGMSLDCNGNLIPDECDLASGAATTIIPSSSTNNDAFGYGIAMANGRALIGAYSFEHTTPGEAYIFHREGATWIQDQQLTASDGAVGDDFGSYVALSQDTAIISAPSDDPNGIGSGSVYVFNFDGSSWVEAQKLTASDGAPDYYFGGSLALLGDVACIGAYDDMVLSGAAYVFRFNGATWQEEQKLIPMDLEPGDCFGYVTVDGNTVISGSPGDDDNGMNSGSAYVFQYNGATWDEQQKIFPSDPATGADFGSYVDISGDVAVIGAPQYEQASPNPGAAYVFRFNGASWVEEQKLVATDGADDDWFGSSAEIDGDFIVVGSPGDSAAGPRTGAAYVFRFNGSTWVELQKLLSPHPSTFDSFGDGVWDIDQNIVLLPDFDCDLVNLTCGPGIVYAFRLGETDCNNNSIPDECDIADCTSDPACGDCNYNLIPDGCDITFGASQDVDTNGVPDECGVFDGGCPMMSNDWSCFDNWTVPGDVYPDNTPMVSYDVTLDQMDDVFLDVDVTINSLHLINNSILRVTQSGPAGDLIIATEGGITIDGDPGLGAKLLVANDRVIDLLCGEVTVINGDYMEDPGELGQAGAAMQCETLTIRPGGSVVLNDMMEIDASQGITLDGVGAIPCTQDGGKTPPILENKGGSSIQIAGDFGVFGNIDYLNNSSQAMTIGGDFTNATDAPQCFDCEQGGIILNGLGAQSFEVGGEDVGPNLMGFNHPAGHTNFSLGTLEISGGAAHNVRFVNNQMNTIGNAACNEALYVHDLILRAGATITLENCRVYYGSLIQESGVTINTVGCGQLLAAGTPCTSHPQCDDAAACTHDRCKGNLCAHSNVEYGNVNGMGPTNANLDDILCVLSGFSNFAACPNGDISPCTGGTNVINLDDILGVLGAFSGNDPCGCVP